MDSKPQLMRVVAPESMEDGLARTMGTKVFVGDQQVTGITRIELVCEVNDVWRARIECHIQPPADLSALAVVYFPSRWQRLKKWWRDLARPANGMDFPR